MIHAYDKVYLEKARTALGRMLDFAVYDLKYEIEDFWGLFLVSGIANALEKVIFNFWWECRALNWHISSGMFGNRK